MSDDALKIWFQWFRFSCGVLNDGVAGDVCNGVGVGLGSGCSDFYGARSDMTERYGITRHADFANVLEVDFKHWSTVRTVRERVYGERRSPLADAGRVK